MKTKIVIKRPSFFCGPGESIPSEILEKINQVNAKKYKKHADYIKELEKIFWIELPTSKTSSKTSSLTYSDLESDEKTPPGSVEILPHGIKQTDSYFLAGFIEGEGSINVSAKKLETAKFGLLIDPEFSITQHVSGFKHLHVALRIFGAGRVRHKSGSKATLTFTIDNRLTLIEKVIPWFKKYLAPISSLVKRKKLENFEKILRLLEEGHHQDLDTFKNNILPIWNEMRQQTGQINQTFPNLEAAQDYITNFKK